MPADTLTTPALLDRVARDLPDHPALIDDGRVLSFVGLRDAARRAAAGMMARGIGPGDRVAIWLPNTWQWAVAALGTHYAGAVLVPLNIRCTGTEVSDILTRSRARLLVAAADRPALPSSPDVVQVPIESMDADRPAVPGGPVVALTDVDARAAAVRPDDLADIFFTSGTTGRSKGVMCSHRQSLTATEAVWAATGGLDSSDRYLCVNPFFHTFGYKFALLACLQAGAALFPQRDFDPEAVMAAVARNRITVFPGPPAIFQALLDHPARDRYDLSSWRLAVTGATTLPVSLVRRMQTDLDVDTVVTGYGLTEASGYGTTCGPDDDAATVAQTCGRPIPGFELRIDGTGEVLLRGPNVMLGYLDDPQGTGEAIDAEGWLHTGDLGSLDKSGNLRVAGRIKDMYVSGGFNVYPAEVEQVLSAMSAVADVAVVGVPDPLRGEAGRAFVVRRRGAAAEPADVLAYARAHLADFKVPRSVMFLDSLPRNSAGKILKTELRQAHFASAVPLKPVGLGGPPIGEVEQWVADIWQRLLNIELPGRRDKFVDLGGDSLAAVEFLRLLQAQFGVRISIDGLTERPTIAAVVAGLERGESAPRRPVLRLRDDGAGPVCLMVPGIDGYAWRFTSLAGALSGPCDVRVLSLIDLRDGPPREFRSRITSAAAAALQPDCGSGRPIVVIGYSFGAMIAADIACRLVGQGTPVHRLLLLDPDPLDSATPIQDFRTGLRSEKYLVFAPGSAAARQLEDDVAEVAKMLQEQYFDGSIRLPPVPVSWLQSAPRAARDAGVMTVFRSPVASVARTVIDLDHLGMMRIPQVYELAGWLDRQLASI